MTDFTYIRDTIVIDDNLMALIKQKVSPGGTIRLVARQIEHAPGFDWKMADHHVVIVAGVYNSNGGSINVDGAPGSDGSGGDNGGDGIAAIPGGMGSPGRSGNPGTAATDVRIICEVHLGGEPTFSAKGGAGGKGGEGGGGGRGADGHKGNLHGVEEVAGTSGGSGGPGGAGGPGGNGGKVLLAQIKNASFAPPLLAADGGLGGSGGPGGGRGKMGKFAEANNAVKGPAGAPGPSGTAGQVTNSKVSPDDYRALVLAELGPDAATWIAHRLAVGEYLYRTYTPEVPSLADHLIRAMREFDEVLRLDPANAQAKRLQQQILQNQNILGLPRDLDLIPNFKEYMDAFTRFGSLVFGVFNQGIGTMLVGDTLDAIKTLLEQDQRHIEDTLADTKALLGRAMSEQKDAEDEAREARDRVKESTRQIEAAMGEMEEQSFSIGDLVGPVVAIGAAVASVAAAIPSGGTSLVALVPAVTALSTTVIATAEPIIIDALFKQEAPDLNTVKGAFQNVGRDVTREIPGFEENKAVLINGVNLVHKLTDGTTPANAKSVALVQRSVELIHAQLLAEHRRAQAAHAVEVVGEKLGRVNAMLETTRALVQQQSATKDVIREAGLSAIRVAQMHVDSLLRFAFFAQRSLEIYTLKSEVRNLFLDTGYVHPDKERDYVEGVLKPADLIALYIASWNRLLQPIGMQDDYVNYLKTPLDDDVRRLSFIGSDLLQFKETHDFQFAVNLDDLAPTHFNAKIQGVVVAFVGATSRSGTFSCDVRHAGRYEQRQSDGRVVVQLLKPLTDKLPNAHTKRLELGGVDFGSTDDPLTAPGSLRFWGRGVAGLWGLTIPKDQFDLEQVDLTNLSEIQVWVHYQFFS